MLVLTRKFGEEIVIEGNGRTVLRIVHVSPDGSQVKLGFVAPRDILIQRAEIRPNPTPAGNLFAPLPRVAGVEHGFETAREA